MARRATRPLRQPTPHPSGATPPNLPAELVPNHVAIVMDGNGRWAKERGLPRIKGHEMGEASLLDCVHGAIELGISHISAYAFSTENWKRSPEEVKFLMGFNRDVIRRRRDEMNELGVRVRWAGRRKRLWKSVIDELETAEEMTRANTTLTLTMCVNYGGRAEIADAAHRIADDVRSEATGSGQDHRTHHREVPRRARHARRRSVRPLLRRAAHLQLPDLAVRLRRDGFPGHPVAGFRSPAPVARL